MENPSQPPGPQTLAQWLQASVGWALASVAAGAALWYACVIKADCMTPSRDSSVLIFLLLLGWVSGCVAVSKRALRGFAAAAHASRGPLLGLRTGAYVWCIALRLLLAGWMVASFFLFLIWLFSALDDGSPWHV
ncbi:MAG: hypothetical protein ACRYFR_05330 [Janthinobacterium lividum]